MNDKAISFLGLGIGSILAVAALPLPLFVSAPAILFALCWTYAAICILSQKKRPWLEQLFAPTNRGALYLSLVDRPASWPRDWRLYDWALRLAVIYPMALALLPWVLTGQAVTLGGPADLGGLEIAPASRAWWDRPFIISAVAIACVAFQLERLASPDRPKIVNLAAEWFPHIIVAGAAFLSLTVAGSGAFALVCAGGITGAFAGRLSGSIAIVIAVTVASAIIVTGVEQSTLSYALVIAGSFMLPVALILLTETLAEREKNYLAYVLLTIILVSIMTMALYWIEWDGTSNARTTTFLLIGLLPLLNALFDAPSYALTLTLLRQGYRNPTLAIPYALLDLAAALALFFLTGAGLVLAVANASTLAGVELYPLAQLLTDVGQEPWAYWWLYAMVFSTVIPTMLHLSAAAFSSSAWFLPGWRAWVLEHLDSNDALDGLEVITLIAVFFVASLTLPFVLLFLLGVAAEALMPGYLGTYLQWLKDIACWAGPLSCPA